MLGEKKEEKNPPCAWPGQRGLQQQLRGRIMMMIHAMDSSYRMLLWMNVEQCDTT